MVVLRIALFASTLGLITAPAGAQPFDQLYIFGDSLSDTGRSYAASGETSPPSPPYFEGRFSDGPVWVEYLAEDFAVPFVEETNYAWAGARADSQTDPIHGLLTQLGEFEEATPALDPQGHGLYVILIGANDYVAAREPETVVNAIEIAISGLAAEGASTFLVSNLPDLGRAPLSIVIGGDFQENISSDSDDHNQLLEQRLPLLEDQLGVSILLFDLYTATEEVYADPSSYGFTETVFPCRLGGEVCTNPEERLWWDEFHPTTRAHEVFAQSAASLLREQTGATTWVLF